MAEEADAFHSYLLQRFVYSLGEEELGIIENIPFLLLQERIRLLITRRPVDGEPDIFCAWHSDGKTIQAIFLSLHPNMPIMAFSGEELKERIENLKRQKLPYDQSQIALTSHSSCN